MEKFTLEFTQIPAWVKPTQANPLALWEVAALLNLEGQWLRLSADDQRALIGFATFGKQSIKIEADGTVLVQRKTCFGSDCETGRYSPAEVRAAASARLRLSPGVFGARYA